MNMIAASNLLTANSNQPEQIKYIYDCCSKQYNTSISKIVSTKQHFPINKQFYTSSIEHKSISVREYVVFYLSLLHMLQNKDVRVDNLQKSNVLYVLHKLHGQIYFLNNVGNTKCFYCFDKLPIFLVPNQIQFLSHTWQF